MNVAGEQMAVPRPDPVAVSHLRSFLLVGEDRYSEISVEELSMALLGCLPARSRSRLVWRATDPDDPLDVYALVRLAVDVCLAWPPHTTN